jgi:hypothetical protein
MFVTTNSIELPACAIVQQRKAGNNQHKIRVATNNFDLEFKKFGNLENSQNKTPNTTITSKCQLRISTQPIHRPRLNSSPVFQQHQTAQRTSFLFNGQ